MKNLTYLIITISLVLLSCSSDPCEDVTCVNGSCVDGTCECTGDYFGPLCNQLQCENGTSVNGSCDCNTGYFGNLCQMNLFGIYHANTTSPIGCSSDFLIQGSISNDIKGERICNQNADGSQTCFWFRIWLEDDLSFTLNLNQIIVTTSGEEQLAGTSLVVGSFTSSDEKVILVPDNGVNIDLDISNSRFSVLIPADDCQLQFDFEKI